MIERINQLMRKEGLSELQFAKRIGVPQSSVNGYLAGKNTPPTKFLTSVIAEFSDVSTEWLMRGKGAMYISDIPTDGDAEQVVELKAEVTRLRATIAELRDENQRLNERTDKLIDILYRDDEPQRKKA